MADESYTGGIYRRQGANALVVREPAGMIELDEPLFEGFPWAMSTRRNWSVFFDDFLGTPDLTNDWLTTAIGTQTVTPLATTRQDVPRGVLRLTGDATDDDGIILTPAATTAREFVQPAAGGLILFEARVSLGDVTDPFFIGLCNLATPSVILTATGGSTAGDSASFRHIEGGAGLPSGRFGSGAGGGSAIPLAASAAPVSGTLHRYGLRIEGTTVCKFYFDGVLVGTGSASLSNSIGLGLAVCAKAAVAPVMDIDYVLLAQRR